MRAQGLREDACFINYRENTASSFERRVASRRFGFYNKIQGERGLEYRSPQGDRAFDIPFDHIM